MCETASNESAGSAGWMAIKRSTWVDSEGNTSSRVPPELAAVGVLIEPLSIVEKAIDEVLRLRSCGVPMPRNDAPTGSLDAGASWPGSGPVGLLRRHGPGVTGGKVYGLDVMDPRRAGPSGWGG